MKITKTLKKISSAETPRRGFIQKMLETENPYPKEGERRHYPALESFSRALNNHENMH